MPDVILISNELLTSDENVCPRCKTDLLDSPGIGLYCPNKECPVLDNISGTPVPRLIVAQTSKEQVYEDALRWLAESADAKNLTGEFAAYHARRALERARNIPTANETSDDARWIREAKGTLDKLYGFLQAKNVPYAVDTRDWIDNALRVLDAYKPPAQKAGVKQA